MTNLTDSQIGDTILFLSARNRGALDAGERSYDEALAYDRALNDVLAALAGERPLEVI